MQPDPTPDLDELERQAGVLAAWLKTCPRFADGDYPDPAWSDRDSEECGNALPWLLRAARERDELRAMYEQAVSPSASCAAERAAGNGGCGACAICCNELRACVWSRGDDDTDKWEGSCGVAWVLWEGTPAENGMNYCPRCGAKLEQEKETTDAE